MLDKIQAAINSSNGVVKIPKIEPHWNLQKDKWIISKFREDEIQFDRHHIIDEMEKYHKELYNDLLNHRNTVPKPVKMELADNVVTLIGITFGFNCDQGVDNTTSTGSIDFVSLGSSATTPDEGDTDLTSEFSGGTPTYARKQISTDGQRTVTNQTAKYGMLWDDGDLDPATHTTIREGGLNWSVSTAANLYAHVTHTAFTFDAGDLFVIQINVTGANA